MKGSIVYFDFPQHIYHAMQIYFSTFNILYTVGLFWICGHFMLQCTIKEHKSEEQENDDVGEEESDDEDNKDDEDSGGSQRIRSGMRKRIK